MGEDRQECSSPIDVLCRELDNTSIPLPFEIYATMETSGFHRAIKIIHAMIDILVDKPIRKKRGFFNVDPESVLKIFQSVACWFDDACIRRYENNVPIDEPLVNAIDVQNSKNESPILSKDTEAASIPKFRFSRVGVKPGDRLVFVPRGIEVTVYDDSRIVYAGKRYSLSAFTREFIPVSAKNASGSYRGTMYFTFEGRLLVHLRDDVEGLTGRRGRRGR